MSAELDGLSSVPGVCTHMSQELRVRLLVGT